MARTAVIKGLGVHLPPQVVTNSMLAQEVDTSDQWIRSRTGIRQRHIAAEHETTSELAVHAGQKALESAGITQVDAVLLSTTTPNEYCPGTAPRVASELGLPKVAALDISAACSGFVYGVSVANSMISAGLFKSVL
ncbi:MAG: 3-oxoacyl-ACP synthase, partial [Myxococcota bacterium]